jgi:gliding motility-associated-like protein
MRSATVLKENLVTVHLFLDTLETCKGIIVERSDNGLNFKQVGYLPILSGVANYTLTDDSAKSNQYSYYYRALVVDNCGNPRTPSNISRTMLLKVEEDKDLIFNKHLSWNSYSGFAGGVSGYNIYRVVNDAEPGEAITSLGLFATDYLDNMQDEAPKGSKVQYIVEAVEGIGNPYGFYETSRSNARDVYMEGRVFVPDAFVPAGLNKKWLPVTHFIDKSEYRVTVYNRWGNKLFETSDDTQGWDGNGAEYGTYIYLITYKNSRGEYEELKGTFLLMR